MSASTLSLRADGTLAHSPRGSVTNRSRTNNAESTLELIAPQRTKQTVEEDPSASDITVMRVAGGA